MVLSPRTILELLNEGEISITPFDSASMSHASVDLHLGNSFVEVSPDICGIDLPIPQEQIPSQFRGMGAPPSMRRVKVRTMDESYKTINHTAEVGQSVILPPKGFLLATTVETITLGNSVVAYVEGRSSLGRLGLQVQNAGFVDPGFQGEITLELFNASDVPIALLPGRRICQLVFMKMDYPTSDPYRGKYYKQKGATASKIEQDFEVPTKSSTSGVHLL